MGKNRNKKVTGQLNGWLFCLEIIMRTTKNWGFTNSGAELYMLAHAERHRKELERREKSVKHHLSNFGHRRSNARV